MQTKTNVLFVYSCGIMSDKSELKAELERKKQRLAQIREEKKRKEEERKKKEVCLTFCKCFEYLLMLNAKVNVENKQNHQWPSVSPQFKCRFSPHTYFWWVFLVQMLHEIIDIHYLHVSQMQFRENLTTDCYVDSHTQHVSRPLFFWEKFACRF